MRFAHALALAPVFLAAVLGLAVACGDDSSAPTPTAAPTSQKTPVPIRQETPAPTVQATTTGVAPVDAAIRTVLANDVAGLKSKMAFFEVNCSANPSGGIPQPPKCNSGEPDGTSVQVFFQSFGEGAYRRPDDATSVLTQWLSPGMQLYAVRDRIAPDATIGGYRYQVVFVNADGAGNALWVSDRGVVGISFDLSHNPALMARQDGVGKYLIQPAP